MHMRCKNLLRVFAVSLITALPLASLADAQTQTPDQTQAAPPQQPQAGASAAPSQPQITGSAVRTTGLPLPRFASLKSDQVNMRSGPGVRYPIQWVYARKSLPVEITAEYDTWRRIRDSEGTEGWVHQSMLAARRTGVVTGKQLHDVKRTPEPDAETVARAEPGVIGDLLQCTRDWCQFKFDDIKGWLPISDFWGVKPGETLN